MRMDEKSAQERALVDAARRKKAEKIGGRIIALVTTVLGGSLAVGVFILAGWIVSEGLHIFDVQTGVFGGMTVLTMVMFLGMMWRVGTGEHWRSRRRGSKE